MSKSAPIESQQKNNVCCLCGKTFTEYPNTPWPVAEEGKCCDECDATKVTPARLILGGVKPEQAYAFGRWFHENVKPIKLGIKQNET